MIDLHHLPNPIADESLVYSLRRHPITLLTLALGYGVLLIFPFAAWWYLSTYSSATLEDARLVAVIVMGSSAFFLFAWLFLFQNFLDYQLDMWIVTTRRILNIEQTGLFSRTVSELRMYRIQDVTATVSGVLHTVFDYGDVEIQTAGEKVRFVFEEIPHPNAVAKKILELSECDRREHLDEAVEEFALADRKKQATSVSTVTEP
jgi:uncharacterized membrane protein YdbT with pleckstrin-like domain